MVPLTRIFIVSFYVLSSSFSLQDNTVDDPHGKRQHILLSGSPISSFIFLAFYLLSLINLVLEM